MSLEKVQEALKGTELESEIIVLEQSSATVQLAAEALHCEPDHIAKTLSFMVDEKPILIVVSGESKVDNKKFKDQFHTKAKMIAFDQVEELVGHAPGGVCPFADNKDVIVYLDQSLKKYDIVYPAAGSGNSAVKTTISQLEKYSDFAEWVDVCKEIC
ncbi:MAG: YbaK/EbsC family protein [Lachnospiraceae bacterium]|nr:YbaK/EbsC family protein [Lachnospiraceae bacterium]